MPLSLSHDLACPEWRPSLQERWGECDRPLTFYHTVDGSLNSGWGHFALVGTTNSRSCGILFSDDFRGWLNRYAAGWQIGARRTLWRHNPQLNNIIARSVYPLLVFAQEVDSFAFHLVKTRFHFGDA